MPRQSVPQQAGRARPGPLALTAAAMVAFAANSVLARAAFSDARIDPGSYTLIRLSSGALVLAAIVSLRAGIRVGVPAAWRAGSWGSAATLFGYAAGFAFAYVSLGAGTGALLLFGVVQLCILGAALLRGERLEARGWVGFGLALTGVVVLVGPGLHAPDPWGATLMIVAGVCWAGYTLRGRQSNAATLVTSGNFIRAVPFGLGLALIVAAAGGLTLTAWGSLLAVASGALASGLGYALWYAALPALTRTESAIWQLTPAPLAAVGGLILLGEPLTWSLVAASVLVLGGVTLALTSR